MTTVIAAVGDTHCGSTVGLCPPIYELNGQGHREANTIQKWLWRSWIDYWHRIDALVEQHNADLWVVLNGDIVEGVHHGTTQVVSLRVDDMMNIALSVLEPRVRKAKHLFVTKGTEAHVGAGAGGHQGRAVVARRDPAQVLVGDFDDIGHANQPLQPGAMGRLVFYETRPDIRVERNDPAWRFA